MEVFIRRMTPKDSSAITDLTRQLGYPLPSGQISQNIVAVTSNKDHDAFVAVNGDRVIGWIGVAYSIQIEAPPYCEVRGLVVADAYRGKGIGKLLVERAKEWGKEKGNDKVRLRCNIKRTETHLFYQHLGFKEAKQQKVFELEI